MLQSNYLKKCSETCSLITPTVVTCNSTLRNVRKHVCPNPKIIQQHLFKTTGFEGSIPQDRRVCPACYIQCPFENKLMSDLRSLIEELKACTTNNLLTNQDDVINPRRACAVLGLRALVCLSVCQLPHFLKLCATKRPSSDTNGCRVTLA